MVAGYIWVGVGAVICFALLEVYVTLRERGMAGSKEPRLGTDYEHDIGAIKNRRIPIAVVVENELTGYQDEYFAYVPGPENEEGIERVTLLPASGGEPLEAIFYETLWPKNGRVAMDAQFGGGTALWVHNPNGQADSVQKELRKMRKSLSEKKFSEKVTQFKLKKQALDDKERRRLEQEEKGAAEMSERPHGGVLYKTVDGQAGNKPDNGGRA